MGHSNTENRVGAFRYAFIIEAFAEIALLALPEGTFDGKLTNRLVA